MKENKSATATSKRFESERAVRTIKMTAAMVDPGWDVEYVVLDKATKDKQKFFSPCDDRARARQIFDTLSAIARRCADAEDIEAKIIDVVSKNKDVVCGEQFVTQSSGVVTRTLRIFCYGGAWRVQYTAFVNHVGFSRLLNNADTSHPDKESAILDFVDKKARYFVALEDQTEEV